MITHPHEFQSMILRPNHFVAFTLILCHSTHVITGLYEITSLRPLRHPDALISNNGVYKLCFFNLDNSSRMFVGIQYNQAPNPIVWIANRNRPLQDNSGVITISKNGNLVVLNAQNATLWSTNVTGADSSAVAWLLDSGNLVLNNAAGESQWEAFGDPGDTFYSDMKLGVNKTSGKSIQLTSWRSTTDPATGDFTAGLSPRTKAPEIFIWKNGSPYARSGPWNKQLFTGFSTFTSSMVDGTTIGDQKNYTYFAFAYANQSLISMFRLIPQGKLQQIYWSPSTRNLTKQWTYPVHRCNEYGTCGPFSSCSTSRSKICRCLRGFEPRDEVAWGNGNWSSGCVRKKDLQCEKDGFLKMEHMRVPDFAEWTHSTELQCKEDCLKDCSCIAYAYSSGIGCLTWNQNLVDMEQLSISGIALYIRLERSELGAGGFPKALIVGIAFAAAAIIALFILCHSISKRRRKQKAKIKRHVSFDQRNLQAMRVLSLDEVLEATGGFAEGNKLGQGGFGHVFKGTFEEMKIAVKRLSTKSGQGIEEFMTEVEVISKLQHRNLVRLFGCCVEGDERMLVYEYLENRSLDVFLFDPQRRSFLRWETRFGIINGICRGLLYLHKDSRLRIIHRDLKASNILLDEDLNPKISDFGLARIFTGKEDVANTRHVVGTYGYMSPEYAMEGIFSEKSDVFSLGVLLLEIVSGKKNTSFHDHEHGTLAAYASSLWNEGDFDELIDPAMADREGKKNQIVRCIHVGLLCIEEFANDRPMISNVISMINNEHINLPRPKQPAFSGRHFVSSLEFSSSHFPEDAFTISLVEGR